MHMNEWTVEERRQFGKRLRDARLQKKMSQTEVAAIFGLEKQAVSHWEQGRNLPSAERLDVLAKHLQFSLDFVVCNKPSPVQRLTDELLAALARLDEEAVRRIENTVRGSLDMLPLMKPLHEKQRLPGRP